MSAASIKADFWKASKAWYVDGIYGKVGLPGFTDRVGLIPSIKTGSGLDTQTVVGARFTGCFRFFHPRPLAFKRLASV